VRNRDTHYGYRFDSYFYYLTGFREPEAVLVLVAGDTPQPAVLPQQGHRARDLGRLPPRPRGRPRDLRLRRGPPHRRTRRQARQLLANQPAIFHSMGYEPDWDRRVTDALNRVRAQARTAARPRPRSATCAA
jgi:Xaa-Pro aminopeptidase